MTFTDQLVRFVRLAIRSFNKRGRCLRCGRRFSHWFTWMTRGAKDHRFCYPCWSDTGCLVIFADRRVMRGYVNDLGERFIRYAKEFSGDAFRQVSNQQLAERKAIVKWLHHAAASAPELQKANSALYEAACLIDRGDHEEKQG